MNGIDFNKVEADGKALAWRLASIAADGDTTATLEAIQTLFLDLYNDDLGSADHVLNAALMETFTAILPSIYRNADHAVTSPSFTRLAELGSTFTDVFQEVIRDRLLTLAQEAETRTCADCIRNMTHDRTTPTCDRCGAGGELHPCLARSAHSRFAFALCTDCLGKERG